MKRAVATVLQHRAAVIDWASVIVLCALTVAIWTAARPDQPLWSLPVDLTACVALAWRRTRPLAVLAFVIAVDVTQIVADVQANTLIYVTLIAIYSVAAYASRNQAVVALLVAYAAIFGAFFSPFATIEGGVVEVAAFMAAAAILGDYIRTRRDYLAGVEERAARLERERDTQAQIVAAAERTRIAREMHDVVAHSLSVMVAQADAAAYVFDSKPTQARQAIGTVAETGRLALTEMHRLLDVLRSTDSDNEMTPQPGVEQLDTLIARTQTAGLPVTLTIQGSPVPLSAGLSLTVYRIVQEALTNTLKHAGPAVSATVQLRYLPSDVEIDVTDTGDRARYPRPDAITPNGGHGLTGMRERTAVFGGDLQAGPLAGSGWRIHARLPLQTPA